MVQPSRPKQTPGLLPCQVQDHPWTGHTHQELPQVSVTYAFKFIQQYFFIIYMYLFLTVCTCSSAAIITSEAVKSGVAVVQLPLPHTQTALITTAATTPVTQVRHYFLRFVSLHCWTVLWFFFKSCISSQVEIVGKPQPAAPSQPATPGTQHELKQYRKNFYLH